MNEERYLLIVHDKTGQTELARHTCEKVHMNAIIHHKNTYDTFHIKDQGTFPSTCQIQVRQLERPTCVSCFSWWRYREQDGVWYRERVRTLWRGPDDRTDTVIRKWRCENPPML